MSILINMEMPTTGLYFVSVDNTGGRDKTVVTVERMLGNRDVRQIVGSFELVPVPQHGRLGDLDKLEKSFREDADAEWNRFAAPVNWADAFDNVANIVADAPTIIPAEEDKT